eukprot:10457207-Ditylum_brightwellii.AAC.1
MALPEKEHAERLETMLERGNHKLAKGTENEEILLKLTSDDAQMGFGFAVTKDTTRKMVKGEIYPFGINKQASINKKGEVVTKNRAVHNLLFEKKKGRSVNQQVRMEELEKCIYRFAFLRQLYYMYYIRSKYPREKNWQLKADMTKAYRRYHVWGHIAAACMTLINGLIFILCGLPFGSAAAPS